jgi:hypothetical protein
MKMGGHEGRPGDDRFVKKHVPVPRRYADPKTSGLSYTVTPGKQSHDIRLEP